MALHFQTQKVSYPLLSLGVHVYAVFPLKLCNQGKYRVKIQEYRVKVSEYYIIGYCNTSPRKRNCQYFTYLKKFPRGREHCVYVLMHYYNNTVLLTCGKKTLEQRLVRRKTRWYREVL